RPSTAADYSPGRLRPKTRLSPHRTRVRPSRPGTPMPRMFRGPLTAGLIAVLMLCCTATASAAVKLLPGKAAPSGVPTVTLHAYAGARAATAAPPEWQLRDTSNQPLYVGGRPAADFGNPAFRAWWIARAQARVGGSLTALFIDDVFMERRTYTAGGTQR